MFEPMHVTCTRRDDFRGRATAHELGPLTIFRVTADASAIHRRRRSSPRATPSGCRSASSSRPVPRRAGRPIRRRAAGRARDLGVLEAVLGGSARAVRAAQRLLPGASAAPAHGRPVRPDGDAPAVRQRRARLLTKVARGLDDASLSAATWRWRRRCWRSSAACTPAASRRGVPAVLLRGQVRAYIAARAGDHDLAPGPSPGAPHLAQLPRPPLRGRPRTVTETIRDARLERCRRDLADPRLADRTILDIALSSGFTSAAHFSRAFRAHYDVAERRPWWHRQGRVRGQASRPRHARRRLRG